jgi:hypothetical protein
MARTRRSIEEMVPLLEAFARSGETIKAFCERSGVPVSVFTYWRTKYRREVDRTGDFVEITPTPSEDRALAEVVFPSGVRIRFFGPVAPAYLAGVVSQAGRER